MASNEGDFELEPRQEQLIFALLKSDTKADAARMAGIPLRTMYHWFNCRGFMRAYRKALREEFSNAVDLLQRKAVKAVQVLADEMDESTASLEPTIVSAARSFLDRAFKAQDTIRTEEELADLREIVEQARSGVDASPVDQPDAKPETKSTMSEAEAVEAATLRVAWMTELGMDGKAIESSLKFNRPQSVTEEAHMLEQVRKLLEVEEQCSQIQVSDP